MVTTANGGTVSPVIGIDLGTTWSVIATIDEAGKAQIIPNSEGELKTPSVVLFEEGNPEAVVGKVAMMSAQAMPERVVSFAKRQIGRERPPTWEFDGKTYRPEEISALVLRKLKQDAEQFLGQEIKRAVITVPAYFDMARRNATANAGTIAGLEVQCVLDEPVAAALTYGLDKLDEDRNIVVYDLGGGTFDVTVIRIEGGQLHVLAKGGNAELGGKDWDDAIVAHVAEQFEAEFQVDPREDSQTYQPLYDAALFAKESLSRTLKARITVNHPAGRHTVELTREEFDRLTQGLLNQTKATLESILDDADGISSWDQVDTVLLVGGSTKMCQVREMVAATTGREVRQLVEPDYCVGMGAALYAAELAAAASPEGTPGHGPGLPPPVVIGASSRFYGMQALDTDTGKTRNFIMICKNDPIPFDDNREFYTIMPDQRAIEMKVLESEAAEEDPAAPGVKCIVEGSITGLPPGLPEEYPVNVRFRFTGDGRLRITGTVTVNGRDYVKDLEVVQAGGMSSSDVQGAVTKVGGLRIS